MIASRFGKKMQVAAAQARAAQKRENLAEIEKWKEAKGEGTNSLSKAIPNLWKKLQYNRRSIALSYQMNPPVLERLWKRSPRRALSGRLRWKVLVTAREGRVARLARVARVAREE